MTTTGPRPLIDIFPPGLDIHSKSTTSRGHFNFAPEQLYHRLTDTYLPEHHVESTIVKSVWYGKQKRSARHEFILIEVQEIRTELKNYIVLDRNLNEAVAPTGNSIVPAGSSRCCRSAALDAFRVSYDGIEKQLLRECELWPRDYLEKIDFVPTEPFFLYQLATLVHVVSEKSPNYVAVDQNCYWFAGLIWECIRHLRPNAVYDDRQAKDRGKFSILHYKPKVQERDAICDAFNKDIKLVEVRLSESRQFWRLRGFPGPEAQDSYELNTLEGRSSYHSNRHSMGKSIQVRDESPPPILAVSSVDSQEISVKKGWGSRYGKRNRNYDL